MSTKAPEKPQYNSDKVRADADASAKSAPPPPLNRERRVTDKKRPDTPVESFLREAKRVIPPIPTRRNQNNQIADSNRVSEDRRFTSTPSSAKAPPHPVALSNMFAALESNESHDLEEGVGRVKKAPIVSVDITSPEQFPSLPKKAAVTNPANVPNETNGGACGPAANQSWAEVDDEASRTIEAFLASESTPNPREDRNAPLNNPSMRNNENQPPNRPPIVFANTKTSRQTDSTTQSNRNTGAYNNNAQRGNSNASNTDRGATGGAYGGARPKGSSSTNPGRMHPDRIVSRNGWYTEGKKRKRTTSSPGPAICGGQIKPFKDVFVRSLKADIYEGPGQMADSVQDYCEERGVGVFFIKVLNNGFGDGYANVRMTVATCDYETVTDRDFWPESVSAREWYVGKDKKGGNPNGEGVN